MPSRVGGVLALIAVALLGVSLLVPWWSGHPTVDGHDTRLVSVDITLFGGERCNTGGDGECTKLPLVGGFKTLEAMELGAVAAAAALAAALAALALAGAAARKPIGRFAIAGGGAAIIVGLVLLATGPDIHVAQTVVVPTGFGGFVALAGGLAAIVAGAVARKDNAVRPRVPMPMPAMAPQPMAGAMVPLPPTGPVPAAPQPFDVQALLRDDALRPTLPPSPGGGLPGPAGPIVPIAPASAPLFQSAPQLRPLYEMPGPGYVPPPPPPLPTRAPTPISRAELENDSGALPPRLPPPQRRTMPPPPGSQGPPGQPSAGARRGTVPPSFGSLAQTALGVSPMSSPSPSAAPPPRPAAPPPPRMPPQPVITSPRSGGVSTVPTPPPLAIPTPPPVTADLEPDDLEEQRDDDDDDDRDDRDDAREDSESSFDARETYGLDPEPAADNTSPGLGIALEETPAAELLAPDDIETRGLRRLSQRELFEEPAPPPAEDPSIDEEPGDITDDSEPVAPPPPPAKPSRPVPTPLPARGDVAYASTMLAEQSPLAAAVAAKAPVTTAPQQLPPPRALETPPPNAGPSPACPQCEAPMAWVEEHLRFYCRSCKMYF